MRAETGIFRKECMIFMIDTRTFTASKTHIYTYNKKLILYLNERTKLLLSIREKISGLFLMTS